MPYIIVYEYNVRIVCFICKAFFFNIVNGLSAVGLSVSLIHNKYRFVCHVVNMPFVITSNCNSSGTSLYIVRGENCTNKAIPH